MTSDDKTDRLRKKAAPAQDEAGEINSWPDTLPCAPAPSPVLQIPPELVNHPRYRVVRLLGQGGMSTVFLAEHLVMDRKVALKLIRLDAADRSDLVERFRREVRVAAQLDHPHIVRAFDAEQLGAFHVLVMEFIEGVELVRVLARYGALPIHLACRVGRQVALGLQYAHEKGLVHRDIKPGNLMVTPKGQIKILDFGLARLRESGQTNNRLTATDVVMGTPDYLAPEQALNAAEADIRADIYSLGCTLYHCLTGQLPFPVGDSISKINQHLSSSPIPIRQLRPEVPIPLIEVVGRMMAKERKDRYPDPLDAARALAPFCASGEVQTIPGSVRLTRARPEVEDPPSEPPSEPPAPRRRGPRRRKTGRWVWVVAGLAALLGIGLGIATVFVWMGRPGRVTVTSVDPNVRIEVYHDGHHIETLEVGDGLDLRWKPGPYELRIAHRENHPGLRVEPETFHLRGGGRQDVKITRGEPPPPRRPPPFKKRPGKFKFKGELTRK